MTSSSRLRPRTALAGALVAAAVLGTGVVAAGAATPSPSPSPSEVAEDAEEQTADDAESDQAPAGRTAEQQQRKDEQARRKAERKADQAQRKADRPARGPAAAGPAFVCDPALSHGQNVSAYARSLPKGPGRGRLVSQAARSDCGKPSGGD